MEEDYWWPQMTKFINKYVEGCTTCQQSKVNTHPIKLGLLPLQGAQRPFQYISIDFITDLPKVSNYDSILTVIDQGLTKTIRLIPCSKTTDAAELVKILIQHIFIWFGIPDKIISDRGPQFISHLFQQVCTGLNITSALSTAFHPQTDGETECVNQEISTYLRMVVANNETAWVDKLPLFEWFHNSSIHSSTGEMPAKLLFRFNPKLIPQSVEHLSNPNTTQ
jgi:hypothetical protein